MKKNVKLLAAVHSGAPMIVYCPFQAWKWAHQVNTTVKAYHEGQVYYVSPFNAVLFGNSKNERPKLTPTLKDRMLNFFASLGVEFDQFNLGEDGTGNFTVDREDWPLVRDMFRSWGCITSNGIRKDNGTVLFIMRIDRSFEPTRPTYPMANAFS
jgi:hypothetical protein